MDEQKKQDLLEESSSRANDPGRETLIVRASRVNIMGNIALAFFKASIGLASNSIAIVLDAVNSGSDALASVITIVASRIAQRPANREHPFGYGRMEYLASTVIAALVLAAGVSSFVEAVKAIVHPNKPRYGTIALVILAASCVTKVVLGLYLRHMGQRAESPALRGSGSDALGDAGISCATLLAAGVFLLYGIDIQAYLAVAIACLIIKSGYELLVEMTSKVLGERADAQLAVDVEHCIRSVEGVRLVNGLVLQDYGPNEVHGSVYLAVDEHMSVADFDEVAREVYQRVLGAHGVYLDAIGPYPVNVRSPEVQRVRAAIGRVVWGHDHVVEVHGLHANIEQRLARFTAVVDFDAADLEGVREGIKAGCEEVLPGWRFNVNVQRDIGD